VQHRLKHPGELLVLCRHRRASGTRLDGDARTPRAESLQQAVGFDGVGDVEQPGQRDSLRQRLAVHQLFDHTVALAAQQQRQAQLGDGERNDQHQRQADGKAARPWSRDEVGHASSATGEAQT
jgi:hypothetical protein